MDISISYDDKVQMTEFSVFLRTLGAQMHQHNPFLAIIRFAYFFMHFD
jgi:hypothetical protein